MTHLRLEPIHSALRLNHDRARIERTNIVLRLAVCNLQQRAKAIARTGLRILLYFTSETTPTISQSPTLSIPDTPKCAPRGFCPFRKNFFTNVSF